MVISYRPSGCVCYLQVLPLLLDADFSFIRSQYFNVRNLQHLFRSVGTSTIIDYTYKRDSTVRQFFWILFQLHVTKPFDAS